MLHAHRTASEQHNTDGAKYTDYREIDKTGIAQENSVTLT